MWSNVPWLGNEMNQETDLKTFESVLQSELEDDSVVYKHDISGGIVNRAALFVSGRNNVNYFVKYHAREREKAVAMFTTERFSLDLIDRTDIVRVPKSIKVFGLERYGYEGGMHVQEYLEDLQPMTDYWAQLGEQVARLHCFNSALRRKSHLTEQSIHKCVSSVQPVDKFGSSVPHFIGTFCPRIGWRDTWQEYFIGDILDPLFEGVLGKYGDRTIDEKWSSIKHTVHKLFESADIQPEINHGDLCPANFGQTKEGPVLFDPSVDYAHSEFDMILSTMEGGFHDDFFTSYYQILPKTPGWEDRLAVYELFYNVVMWYHVSDGKFSEATLKSLHKVSELLQTLKT